MLKLKNWNEVINEDWPDMKITEQTRDVMRRAAQSGRYLINDVRLAIGRFYTDSEYEARRAKILSTQLP